MYDVEIWKKEQDKKREKLEKARKESIKGLLFINNMIIPYDYLMEVGNKKIYVNASFAGGQHGSDIKTFLNGCSRKPEYNIWENISSRIKDWCKLDYRIIKHNDFYIMYVFNEMYGLDYDKLDINYIDFEKELKEESEKELKNVNKYNDLD